MRLVHNSGAASNPPTTVTPLAPIYLAHVGDDGAVLLPYPQAKLLAAAQTR